MHLCISRFMRYLAKQKYQYLVTGVPHPPMSRKQTWEGESRPHLKGWAAGHKGPNSSGRTTAADPLPTRERVRCRHVSLMRGTQYRQQEPWTPSRVRDLHVPPGPQNARGAALRQGGVRHVSRTMGAGASLLLEDSPTYRIKCG